MLTQSYNTSFVIRPKVRISGLLYFLLLIPHLKPALFVLDAELDMLFDVMRVISGACILCIYVFKMAKCNRMIVLVCVLFAIRFVSTLVDGLDTYALIISFVSVICMLLLTDVLLATHTKVGLNILAVSFEILAYANFLTILIWPEGIYYSDNISIGGTRRGYLLGHQTTMIYYCIVGLIALLMLSYLNPTPRNKIRAFLFFTVCS